MISSRAAATRDAVRLCLGTLTVAPVGTPQQIDRGRAAGAMALAPLAGALVGAAAGAVAVGVDALGLPALVVGGAAVATGAAATRVLHLDGVADTADGMAAIPHGGDPDRALAVMRRGDVGPAGVVVVVLVVLGQAGAVGAVAQRVGAGELWLTVTLAWLTSRAVLPVLCTPGFGVARPGGLGATVLRSVPWPVAVAVVAVVVAGTGLLGGWFAAAVAVLAVSSGVAVAALVAGRLRGLTGDVLGAAVEVSLLVALACGASTLRPAG